VKQVEAKILDFDWVFNGDNSAKFIKILCETENNEVFACDQVRVFLDFMWQGYYKAIFDSLFVPFVCYFTSFVLYATYFANVDTPTLSFSFMFKLLTLIVLGKTFMTFVILEAVEFRSDMGGYFVNIRNYVDLCSLVLNALYVFFQLTGSMEQKTLNIMAAFAVFLLYMKLFYWMKLFKPYSAFIRVITEIGKDIRVFSIMLLICLACFANVLMLMQHNRGDGDDEVIFEELVGFAPADALIHSYLTGLGDFGSDNYSEGDKKTVWFMFVVATILVQLVFMNMLIAIMGESFGRVTAMAQQSTYKELANMMNDHIWLLNVAEIFKDKRYIVWLTPDTSKVAGTLVERQIQQLKEYVEARSDATEQKIQRLQALNEQSLKGGNGSGGAGDEDNDSAKVIVEVINNKVRKLYESIDYKFEELTTKLEEKTQNLTAFVDEKARELEERIGGVQDTLEYRADITEDLIVDTLKNCIEERTDSLTEFVR